MELLKRLGRSGPRKHPRTSRGLLALPLLALALNACTQTPGQAPALAATTVAAVEAPGSAPAPASARPRMLVHKNENCGCCGSWVEHMRKAGFVVDTRNEDDMNPVKERLGVPYGKGSCHTAQVGPYFIEGHVPAADIQRLLAEKPAARGLVLPGMPGGSPGMELADGSTDAFVVELVALDGSTHAYSEHPATAGHP